MVIRRFSLLAQVERGYAESLLDVDAVRQLQSELKACTDTLFNAIDDLEVATADVKRRQRRGQDITESEAKAAVRVARPCPGLACPPRY